VTAFISEEAASIPTSDPHDLTLADGPTAGAREEDEWPAAGGVD
jgi:hypothetical protein